MKKFRSSLVALAAAAAVFGTFAGAEDAFAKKAPKEFMKVAFSGVPKYSQTFHATVKGPTGQGTGFYYEPVAGQLVINGLSQKQRGRTADNRTFGTRVFGGVVLDSNTTYPYVIPNSLATYLLVIAKVSLPPQVTTKTWVTEMETGPVSITITAYDAEAGILEGFLTGTLSSVDDSEPPLNLESNKFRLYRLETDPSNPTK